MPVGVWILGGGQSDYARNWTREGKDIADVFAEAVAQTLPAAGVAASDVAVIHVGNAFGQLYTGQGHLGAMPATVEQALAGLPAARHEAACASGGVALLAAMADLEAGRYDVALVIGAELEKAVDGARAAEVMAAAGWVGHEAQGERFMWPWAFDRVAAEYEQRYGLDEQHLRAIGALNRRNARSNPLAQTREWPAPPGSFDDDDAANPVVTGRLRRSDCSQITDGWAALVLVSDAFLARRRLDPERAGASRIAGWGHRSAPLPLEPKLTGSRASDYVMPHVRATILDARSRAGIGRSDQLDLIETHDCFTPSQYLAIDHFGITKPGASWQAVENGTLERDGALPMNPSGGLIGVGHPVGATGVRMVLDAHRQVTGTAGECQVAGARTAATLNIGGSTATTVSFVVTAPPD
jgi:acetyl-CoA C-acetyltransferase